jgi:hypothetical protein
MQNKPNFMRFPPENADFTKKQSQFKPNQSQFDEKLADLLSHKRILHLRSNYGKNSLRTYLSICKGKMQNLIMIRKKAVSFRLVVRIIIESGNRKYMLNMRKEQSWSIQKSC